MTFEITRNLAMQTVLNTYSLLEEKLHCVSDKSAAAGPQCQDFLRRSMAIFDLMKTRQPGIDFRSILPDIQALQQLNRQVAELEPGEVTQGYEEAPMLWQALRDPHVILLCILGVAMGCSIVHACCARPRLRRIYAH